MAETTASRSRARLLQAAIDLIGSADGQDVSLRAVCERAGVTMPTLYHFFGNKEGLLEAVVEHGVQTYLDLKTSRPASTDPIADLRAGWDEHVRFGLENPSIYALMFGRTRPGHPAPGVERPRAVLVGLTTRAAAHGLLRLPPPLAADMVLAANVSATLALISLPAADPLLAASLRDAVLAAITVSTPADSPRDDTVVVAQLAGSLRAALDLDPTSALGAEEAGLLAVWLGRLESSPPAGTR